MHIILFQNLERSLKFNTTCILFGPLCSWLLFHICVVSFVDSIAKDDVVNWDEDEFDHISDESHD